MEAEEERKCKTCGVEKAISEFKPRPGRVNPQWSCIPCATEKQKAAIRKYYDANKAKINAKKKEWFQNNRERWNKYKKEYYYKNLETVRRQGREASERFKAKWPERYRMQHRLAAARYWQKHPELWRPLSLDMETAYIGKRFIDFVSVEETGYENIVDGASVDYLIDWLQTEFPEEFSEVLFAFCKSDFNIEETAETLNKPPEFIAEVIQAIRAKAVTIRQEVISP